MEHKTRYLCDPVLNKDCPKTYCHYNPEAREDRCRWTTKPECAATLHDGTPIVDNMSWEELLNPKSTSGQT